MIALWDLGNVVVQWNPTRILEMLKLEAVKKDIVSASLFEGSLWLDLDRGITTEAEVAGVLAAETELDYDDVLHVYETVRESLVNFPRSIELIKEMKEANIPMYVLSNMSIANFEYLNQRDFFELFDGIVISAQEKLIKPESALFQVVLDRYKLDASETVFMDDSLPNVKAAEKLGMHAVHFEASDDCYAKVRQYFNL